MPDTTETDARNSSAIEVESKAKPSEIEGPDRLEAWAVRRSEARPGYLELRLTGRSGKVLHVFLDPISAYDLSSKLLEGAAELKAGG